MRLPSKIKNAIVYNSFGFFNLPNSTLYRLPLSSPSEFGKILIFENLIKIYLKNYVLKITSE